MARTSEELQISEIVWVQQGALGDLKLLIRTAPSTDPTSGQLYVKSDNILYYKDPLGVESAVSGSSGTVTSVSVVTANGLAGTVANATTTPAITLSTSITGILKGDGTAISAATAGTDYTALAFKTLVVAGQSDIVADTAADTLTIVAGTNITLTTNAGTDTLTITAAESSGATTALDNLASVAINTTLLPASTDSAGLGDATHQWGDLFLAEGGVINWDGGDATITQTNNVIAIAGITDLSVSGNVIPSATDAGALGGASNQWADLFLAEGGVINWDGGDATITQTNNVIAIAGISTLTSTGAITPDSNDSAALGAATVSWSDAFLASGALINFANGNAVITHSSGIISVTTGEFRITSANVGTNADSVPTLSSTSTLTNKTLTAPAIGGVAQLAENASIALDAVLSADEKWTGITMTGTLGATIGIGDLVYLSASDSRWELTDADAAATSGSVPIAICLAAGNDGDPTTLLLSGKVRSAAFPAFTVGAPIYVSTDAGDVTGTQPSGTDDVIRVVGFAITADDLYFNPSNDYITHT